MYVCEMQIEVWTDKKRASMYECLQGPRRQEMKAIFKRSEEKRREKRARVEASKTDEWNIPRILNELLTANNKVNRPLHRANKSGMDTLA